MERSSRSTRESSLSDDQVPDDSRETGPRNSASRRYAISIVGRFAAAGIQALLIALLARALGVDDFGVYAIASSVCFFLVAIFELGTGTTVLRLAAETDPHGTLSVIGIWRGATTLLTVLVVALVAWIAFPGHWWLYFATAVYVTGEALGDLSVGILQAKRRSGAAITLLLARRTIAVIPFAWGIGIEQAHAALLAAGGAGMVAFAVSVLARRARPVRFVTFVREKMSIIITNAARSFSQLDALIVGAVGGVTLAGLYGAAVRLSNPANIAITTLTQVMIPEFASMKDDRKRLRSFRKSRRLVYGFAVLLAASSALSPWIVAVMFGPAFAESAPIVGGVLIAASLMALNQLHMSWFYATSVPRSVVVGTVVTVALGLALLAILAPLFGVWGCAIALVAWRLAAVVNIVGAWLRVTRPLRRGAGA